MDLDGKTSLFCLLVSSIKASRNYHLRFGYTYSSNPIPQEVAFFNIPATAVIKSAYQFGLSYEVNETWQVDAVYHYGDSNGATQGQILSSKCRFLQAIL